jgi:hypothetical protein
MERSINPRLRPDTAALLMLVLALLAVFAICCSSCKSLDKRCSERFPPSLNSRSYFFSKDTLLPPSSLNTAIPCPEFGKTLPSSGKKVILAENDNSRITAERKSNGEIVLEALTKPRKFSQAQTIQSKETTQNICDCSEQIKKAVKSAKFDLVNDSFTFLAIALVVIGFIFYLFKR